jgi:arylsulfatase
MKSLGYATGQFGKNHLGDHNEHLPTVHGFDEFFATSTTSTPRRSRRTPIIRRPQDRQKFGPRGVLHS